MDRGRGWSWEYTLKSYFIDLFLDESKEFNLSFFSDTHLGSTHSADSLLVVKMDKRAQLPGARFFMLGDMYDMVTFDDIRRYLPSSMDPEMATVDDYYDELVRREAERFGKYPWAAISLGNHGFEVLRRHHTNPIARLARKLGATPVGFSGYFLIRFFYREDAAGQGPRCRVVILFHHGGSSGQVTKGLPWAKRFAAQFEDWDLFVWGHNHQLQHHIEPRVGCNSRGTIRKRETHMVNTGTFYDGFGIDSNCEPGSAPSYAERRGYSPVMCNAPLVKLRPRSRAPSVDIEVAMGDV